MRFEKNDNEWKVFHLFGIYFVNNTILFILKKNSIKIEKKNFGLHYGMTD